jgi:hypothetical protein
MRCLTEIWEEQNLVTTEQLGERPMVDLTEDLKWLPDWQAIHRVPSLYRDYGIAQTIWSRYSRTIYWAG